MLLSMFVPQMVTFKDILAAKQMVKMFTLHSGKNHHSQFLLIFFYRKSHWGDILEMKDFPTRTHKKSTNYTKLEEAKKKQKAGPTESELESEADSYHQQILAAENEEREKEKKAFKDEKKELEKAFMNQIKQLDEEEEVLEMDAAKSIGKIKKTHALANLKRTINEARKKGIPDAEIEKRLGKENFRRLMHVKSESDPVDRIDSILKSGASFPKKENVDVDEKIVPKKPEVKKTKSGGLRKRVKPTDDLD